MLMQSTASSAPSWTKFEKNDPLHQISFVEFVLSGKFLVAPQRGSMSVPTLALDCQPGHHRETNGHFMRAWIDTGAVLDSHADKDGNVSVAVEYRLDDGKLQSESWPVSADRRSLFLSATLCNDCVVNNLLYGHILPHKEGTGTQVRKILIGASEYVAGQMQMQFELPDVTDVAETCGLVRHKAK